jgi:hypothetical protein
MWFTGQCKDEGKRMRPKRETHVKCSVGVRGLEADGGEWENRLLRELKTTNRRSNNARRRRRRRRYIPFIL